MSLRHRLLGRAGLLGRVIPAALVAAGLVGLAPTVGPLATHSAAAQTVSQPVDQITPVFSQTLVGDFAQAGNTLFQCSNSLSTSGVPSQPVPPATGSVALIPNNPAAPGVDAQGCGRDIFQAFPVPTSPYQNAGIPMYNDQVVQAPLNRAPNPNIATTTSSSAAVNVPAGAQVVFAELQWGEGVYNETTGGNTQNPNIVPNPNIFTQPMDVSIGDDTHFVPVTPDAGTAISPGTPAVNTSAYYYSAWANITSLMAGKTGQINVWGANAPFFQNAFNRAALGWNVSVVYQFPSVNLGANQVARAINIEEGVTFQQPNSPPNTTTVDIPEITDPNHVHIGVTAHEGDVPINGDTLAINGMDVTQPYTNQTGNFFESFTPNGSIAGPSGAATDPNWTSNFSIDDFDWTLAPGFVAAGDTSMDLTTASVTSPTGLVDTLGLTGLNISVPVPAVCLTKSVSPNPYTTVGQTLTYSFTVTNCSGAAIDGITVSDPSLGGSIADCNHPDVLAAGDAYNCTDTSRTVSAADIAAGHIDNTATANAFVPGTTTMVEPATASATTSTSTTLLIQKAASAAQVNPGAAFSYTITVTNTGGADAANVTVTDPLPAELTGATATVTSGPPGSTATISGTTLTATTPLLPHTPPNTLVITVSGTMAAPTTGTTVTNTATVTAGGNTNCPAPPATPSTDPNCSSTVDTEVLPPAPITITKTVSNSTPSPGDTFTYTVQVSNTSDTTTAVATVSDPIPTELTGASWTCSASTGSTCGTPSGTGDITGVALTLLPLGVATFTITVTLPSTYPGGPITNTATATPGTNTFCEAPSPPTSCSDDVTINPFIPAAPLSITKTIAPTTPVAGQAITYTVTVSNPSATTVAHGTLDDPVPAQIVADGTWTTATTGAGTTVSPATGAGFSSGVTLVIAPGGSVTFTIPAHVSPTFNGANVTNIASVTPGPNTVCADSSSPTCDAQVSFENPAQLSIVKVRSPAVPTPGGTVVYRVIVTNNSGVVGSADFFDPLPTELNVAAATWTCTPSAGSTCGTASGTGSPGVPTAIPITVAPAGGTVTFVITAMVLPTPVAVTVHNVATIATTDNTTCVDGTTTCSADDTFTATPPPATLEITKTHLPSGPAAGGPITYTVTITNTSTTTQAAGTFNDAAPPEIDTTGATWSTATTGAGTTATPPSGTGFPAGVALVIAPGGTVTFTINAHVSATWDGSTVTNIGSVTPGTNTQCADGEPTCDAPDTFTNPGQLNVVKVRSPAVPTPGGTVVYRVIVTNPVNGGVGVGNFSDPLPPELDAAAATWTCTPSAGSTCGTASGTGSPGVPTPIPITVAPNGGTVTFVITATVLPTPVSVTVHNVASVAPTPPTTCVDGQPTCDGDDTFTVTPPPATVTIDKTLSPPTPTPTQGQAFTYTVTVTNTSTTTQAEGTVDDPFDSAALTGISWTATATGGSSVTPASGSGAIAGVAVVLAPGGTVTFTVHATVAADWPGGDVINTSVVTPGTNTTCDPADPSCSDTENFPTPSLISIVKTHEPTNPVPQPGQNVLYRVTVTNLSPQQVAHATFSDPLPAALDAAAARWTTVTAGTGTTASPASGTGSPTDVTLTLAPGGTVTFLITAPILSSFQGGTITNIGTATPGDLTACEDGQPTCDGSTSFVPDIPPAPVSIAKSVTPSGPFAPGDHLTYTVILTNHSTGVNAHGSVTDPVPMGIVTMTWTAVASPGSSITPTSGSGDITGTFVLAPAGTVTYTVAATIDPAFRSDFDIVNTGTVIPGTNTTCIPNIVTQACDANVVITVILPPPVPPPVPPPPGPPAPPTVPIAPPSPTAPPSLPVTG